MTNTKFAKGNYPHSIEKDCNLITDKMELGNAQFSHSALLRATGGDYIFPRYDKN